MSGALFVITIPTEEEEERLRQKIKFNTRIESNTGSLSRLNNIKTKEKEKPRTPINKSGDLQYGTFNQNGNGNISPATPQAAKEIAIDIDAKSLNGSKGNDKNFLGGSSNNVKEDQLNIRRSWEGLKEIVSSARKDNSDKRKKEMLYEIDIPPDSFMEFVLKEILKKFKVENATWTKTSNNKSYQVIFSFECDQKYECLLHKLSEWGIGDREGSIVSISHCAAFHKKEEKCDETDNREELNILKQTAWNRFMNTLTARLNVAQIVRSVRQEATITFDFVVLVVCAAILASFGLIEDSTIFLTSSMLVSPLMGPIIAAIFGTVIKDRSLRSLGVVNELLGIFMATFVGFIFRLIICTVDTRYAIGEGLTTEMLSRGKLHSVIVGILTAIPSGAAAAVGILGGNIGSLVGVAISASLLPPAVNSGLLWAEACIYTIYGKDNTQYNSVDKANLYSNHQALELAILGSISMCVTITNVICVYGMGVIVLKIKEIAPMVSSSRQFWKHDIKIAREINKNCLNDESNLAKEIAALPDEQKEALGFNSELFKSINIDKSSYQNTWSPMGSRHGLPCVENRASVQDLERIYMTMTNAQEQGKYGQRGGIGISIKGRAPHSHLSLSLAPEHSAYRRASLPSPKLLPNYRIETLAQIAEMEPQTNNNNHSKPDEEKKQRKFTITPAPEDDN